VGKEIPIISQSFVEYGVALSILSVVVLLLFLYFKNLINQKSLIEQLLEAQSKVITNILLEMHRIKEDLVEIRTTLKGGFRTKGRDDD